MERLEIIVKDQEYNFNFFLLGIDLISNRITIISWFLIINLLTSNIINLRISEIHLFYNLQLFYWHFLEILWLFIFIVFYILSFLRLKLMVLKFILGAGLWDDFLKIRKIRNWSINNISWITNPLIRRKRRITCIIWALGFQT